MGKQKIMQVLSTISNQIGTFYGVGVVPTANATTVTVSANMDPVEVHDASNWLRLRIEADFGNGYQWMATSRDWQGGPQAQVPTLQWQFNKTHPPLLVRGVLENGIKGAGSPAVVWLTQSFT